MLLKSYMKKERNQFICTLKCLLKSRSCIHLKENIKDKGMLINKGV